jgi:zinc protease
LGLPALKRGDPDFFPLLVGNYTLGGGGFVSRLMKAVRDQRGLAYSVHRYFQPLAQLGAVPDRSADQEGAGAGCTEADSRRAGGLSRTGSRAKRELLAAKQYLIGSFPLRLDSNREILEQVAIIASMACRSIISIAIRTTSSA